MTLTPNPFHGNLLHLIMERRPGRVLPTAGAMMKRGWQDLSETQKDIIFYLIHMASPVSIDDLVSLSGAPIVEVLKVMDDLRRRRLVSENKEYGKGFYFLQDGELKTFARRYGTREEAEQSLRRLVDFYVSSADRGDQGTLALAEVFLKLGAVGEGSIHIKAAATILRHSGHIEQAAAYYDALLQHFAVNKPTSATVEDYLDSVLGKVVSTMYLTAVPERMPLLLEAERVAKHYKKWTYLMRIKLSIGQGLRAMGQFSKASRYVNDFWRMAKRKDDKDVRKKALLMISDYLYLKGRISEVVHRYEEEVGSLEEFGDNHGALRAGVIVGRCYAISGRIVRGMGMIDAVRVKAGLLNLQTVAIFADCMSAVSLLEIGRVDEAEGYANKVLSSPPEIPGHFLLQTADCCKAYILTLRGDYEGAFERLKKSYERLPIVGEGMKHAWEFEYLDILESKGFSHEDMNCDSEIRKALEWDNIYIKGVALRYRAMRNSKRQRQMGSVLPDLKASEAYLKQAGADIELARTRIALGNYHVTRGDANLAKSYLERGWHVLSKIDRNLVPKDLLAILPQEQKIEVMIDRIIEVTESLGTIRDMPSFLDRVMNVAMDFTMAMRGTFFVVGPKGAPDIIASRNFDSSLLNSEKFVPVRQVMASVARDNRELVIPNPEEGDAVSIHSLNKAGINSLICVPASFNNHTYGYLYLDNRLGGTPFPHKQLPYVRLLCNLIGVGLSNIGVYKEMRELKDRFEDEAIFYKREMGIATPLDMIIGSSEGIRGVKNRIHQVAPTDTSVLITGETGVGKELVAKAIHNLSTRKGGPFIPVNLAVLPQDLVASELFGHEKGAFTGAHEKQKGRFELADGGTIFLDEIGDLPSSVQVKLLRVLQEGTFERLGSSKPIQSHFRVIAASNKDLRGEVERGTFRQDLYYRLNVFPVPVPPLRERRDDIPRLAHYFIDKFAKKLGKRIKRIPAEEMKKLIDYHWPGNVRELEHFMERAVILTDGSAIHFSGLDQASTPPVSGEDVCAASLEDMEREYIMKALAEKRWRISGPKGAATVLGLKPQTLHSRMKRLGIFRQG
jgi:transcriptional regulator with GAF, ATPase, and Fis domain